MTNKKDTASGTANLPPPASGTADLPPASGTTPLPNDDFPSDADLDGANNWGTTLPLGWRRRR